MTSPEMIELMQNYVLTDKQFQKVYEHLTDEMNKGLKKKTVDKADTKCFITYVHNLPTGKEIGRFLALDLGGTHFRVLMLFLKGDEPIEMSSEIYTLTKETITGPGDKLFDYIAECLYKFAKEHCVEQDGLPIGFTFSFPCVQVGLEKAILYRWTKGFKAPGVVGENVGRLLKEAIDRQPDLKVGRIAILNDTTGTLMSCAHRNPNCRIGLIIGTGCNACYLERIENTDKIDENVCRGHTHVVINIEWGPFGDGGCIDFIRTDLDRQVDALTPNAGVCLYEKLISGMYIGGLVRLLLHKAIKLGLIFNQHADRNRLLNILEQNTDCFPTQYISDVESDKSSEFLAVRRIINKLFQIVNPSANDCFNLFYICNIVTIRAARLVGVGLANLVNRINEPYTVIGIDGSVFRFNRKFNGLIREQMNRMILPELKYDIMLSEDGSGRGAALVAAVTATRPELKKFSKIKYE